MERIRSLSSVAPAGFEGRGIIIPAGGGFAVSAWVTLSILREVHGCELPIELWYLGDCDLPDHLRRLFSRFDVSFEDATSHFKDSVWHPSSGWDLKTFAVARSRFRECLLLDADNIPLADPTFLFDHRLYRDRGAAFWPDVRPVNPFNPVWSITGVVPPRGFEWESGQLLIDKSLHWPECQIVDHFGSQSAFYYRYVLGDKEAFHLAWRMLKAPYTMPTTTPERALGNYDDAPDDPPLFVGLWQHDFDGRRMFLHRTDLPLVAWGRNPFVGGFELRDEVEDAIAELESCWDGRLLPRISPVTGVDSLAMSDKPQRFLYTRFALDQRELELLPGGRIGDGAQEAECFWRIEDEEDGPVLTLSSRAEDTCVARLQPDGSWRGTWSRFVQTPVELVQLDEPTLATQVPLTDTRPKLLFISPVAPNDAGNGLAMRAANVLRQLVHSHRVSLLIAPLYAPGAVEHLPQWVSERCEAIRWVYPTTAPDLSHFDSDGRSQLELDWKERVGRAFDAQTFDVIHVFRVAAIRFAEPYLTRARHASAYWRLDLDDIESASSVRLANLYDRYGREEERDSALSSARFAKKIEQSILETWDTVYVCSPIDKDRLEGTGPGRRAKIEILPNRVQLPADPPAPSREPPITLLYVGSFDYFPNTDGAIWFCREVIPAMRELSRARFRVFLVGTGVTDPMRELAHIPDVELIGAVQSIDGWYRQSDVVVVPLRAGGGTRIKLLEALAHRRPVVATSMAAEGLDLVDGMDLLIGDRPIEFARHCARLIEDGVLAEQLASSGRLAVERRYAIN